MAKYKAYPEYKDSGVEWLGKIPDNWYITKLKFVANLLTSKSSNEDELFVGLENISSGDGKYLAKDSTLAEGISISFKNNDVLFGKLRPYLAKSWLATFSGVCSSEFLVLRTERLHPRFLNYYLLTKEFIDQVDSSTYGSKMPRASWEFISLLPVPTCSYFLSDKIASFLDHETAKIDNLIEKQQQLIELLKEKRQAVISHAVTKGLNPDVPMKDSGVEWLGEVPAHWTVTRLGYHAIKIGSGKTPRGGSEIYLDEGVLFLRSQNIYDDGLRVGSSECVFIDLKTHNEMKGTRVLEGDILLNITGGSIGRSCIVPTPFIEANVNQHVCILRFRENIREFISYAMKSSSTKEQIEACQVGGNREGLNFEQTSKINICLPPEEEIGAVLEYLKIRLPQLDTLEKNASNIILLLQERRTALISAAVTGKIDVRDWVAPDASDIEISQEAIA